MVAYRLAVELRRRRRDVCETPPSPKTTIRRSPRNRSNVGPRNFCRRYAFRMRRRQYSWNWTLCIWTHYLMGRCYKEPSPQPIDIFDLDRNCGYYKRMGSVGSAGIVGERVVARCPVDDRGLHYLEKSHKRLKNSIQDTKKTIQT
uniref:Uncharacterized protein n=1 Tax=Romanomermis culicivorax TaxID=13658 RepID=A0A915IWA9_ROMCU